MEQKTKFCKHCGQTIDTECVVCPKCGKQVENLSHNDSPIIINNSASSSSSAIHTAPGNHRLLPWYLNWFWIFIFGCFTGGIYWIVGFILRVSWKSKN